MSKMKIIGSLLFLACLITFTVLWVGVFPNWSIATQSIAQQHYSPGPDKIRKSTQNKIDVGDQVSSINNNNDPNISEKESESVTDFTPDPSVQSFQGVYPEESISSQSAESLPITKEDLSESDSSTDEPQSSAVTSSEVLVQKPVQSESKPNIFISSKINEELAPTPLPGSPGTPIHPYYDEQGNPPTAPGLAMRQRRFVPENEKTAYLTFDDGPYPSTTPKILAILAEENIQATFFDIGKQVELYPDLLKAEYEQNHVIGNHTYSHNMAEVYKGPQYFLADLKKAEEIIYQTIGIRPEIVRAPGGTVGHFNINYFNVVDAEGYLMEDWNVDPGDSGAHLMPADQLIKHVEQQIQGKTRVVILLHDLAGKDTTIEALPQIIKLLKEQGFSFGVLGPQVMPIVFPAGLTK